jgi:ankyrin repeat protein
MQGSNAQNALVRALLCALASGALLSMGACAQHDTQTLALRERIEKGNLTRKEIPRFRMSDQDLLEASGASNDFVSPALTELDKALLGAARIGDTEAMQLHIKAGARVNAVDPLGNTPLSYVAASGDLVRARMLLKERAEVEGRGGVLTPLASAALRGHVQMVTLLLSRGADPDAQGLSGVSPLVLAVRLKHLAVADALLKAGARSDAMERTGASLLMMTVTSNQPAMTDLLLRHGADANTVDAAGVSVLDWARQLSRDQIVQSLENAAAREKGLTKREARPYTTSTRGVL